MDSRSHGTLDVNLSNVLPLFLQQRSEEVSSKLSVDNDFLVGHCDISDGNVEAHNLLHLELDGRLFGMNYEAYGVERTHNSESFNLIQKTGRLKSVKDTCDRNHPLKFIRLLKKGEVILYAADQDYGLDQSEIVNFFNQPAATISAPIKIINSTGCKPYFLNSFKDGDKYIIEIEELDFDKSSNLDFLKNLNLFMENKIRKNPEEYLWQHRRFKSTLGKKNFYG